MTHSESSFSVLSCMQVLVLYKKCQIKCQDCTKLIARIKFFLMPNSNVVASYGIGFILISTVEQINKCSIRNSCRFCIYFSLTTSMLWLLVCTPWQHSLGSKNSHRNYFLVSFPKAILSNSITIAAYRGCIRKQKRLLLAVLEICIHLACIANLREVQCCTNTE